MTPENGEKKACSKCGEMTQYYLALKDWICEHCGYSEHKKRILTDQEYRYARYLVLQDWHQKYRAKRRV